MRPTRPRLTVGGRGQAALNQICELSRCVRGGGGAVSPCPLFPPVRLSGGLLRPRLQTLVESLGSDSRGEFEFKLSNSRRNSRGEFEFKPSWSFSACPPAWLSAPPAIARGGEARARRCVGDCEKLVQTPIPQHYTRHTQRCRCYRWREGE